MAQIKLLLTTETFNIGSWHPELDCESEVFLGIVPPSIFALMGWETKRQGEIVDGKGAVFVTRREMIDRARAISTPGRGALLKTLLKTERVRRDALDLVGV